MGAKACSMPLELFHKITDEVHDLWPKAHLNFVYTEPRAWKPLDAALRYARDLGQWTSITTNGLLLPGRGRWKSRRANVVPYQFPWMGQEAVHDKIRRRERQLRPRG